MDDEEFVASDEYQYMHRSPLPTYYFQVDQRISLCKVSNDEGVQGKF